MRLTGHPCAVRYQGGYVQSYCRQCNWVGAEWQTFADARQDARYHKVEGRSMTRSWSFALDYKSAPFGLSLNDRAHWGRKAAATAEVRLVAWSKAKDLPKLEKCRVDVVWVVRTKARRDTDNLAPMLKAIYDGIGADTGVSAHIVPDDAPVFMEKTSATIRYDKNAVQHFEITITEVTA